MDRRKRSTSRLAFQKRKSTSSFWKKRNLFFFDYRDASQRLKKISFAIGVVLLIVVPYYLWSSGYITEKIDNLHALTHHKIAATGFQVRDIMVEGRALTSQKEILDVLNVKRHKSIFIPSLSEVKQKLELLPWVRSATVQRRLPDVLYVRLSERHPIAIWQHKSQMYLVDDSGNTLRNPNLTLPADLLILTGDDAPKHAASLIAALEDYPDIRQKVTGAMFISQRRWDIIIDHKLKVKLSETELKNSLESFWKLMKNHKLDDKDILAIDLRFKDRAYFQLPPHIIERKKGETAKAGKRNA